MEISKEIREAVAETERPVKKKKHRKELSERVGDAIQREMLRVLDNEKASADLKVQASRILLQMTEGR